MKTRPQNIEMTLTFSTSTNQKTKQTNKQTNKKNHTRERKS